MAPSGAKVTSPDRITDKVTGELREVDASIRYKLGTCPVLVTIECRDRTSIEDVRWIEQLAEKTRSIGASITVAVTSTGFSEPAIRKAKALGIQTRILKDAAADDLVNWLKFHNVQLEMTEWGLAELALELYDAPDKADLLPQFGDAFRDYGTRAQIFIRNSDDKRFHVENFLIEWEKRNGTLVPPDLPGDGQKVRRNLHQPLERGCFHVETNKGLFDIRVLHIDLVFSRTILEIPFSRIAEYADDNFALVQSAEWNLQDNVKLSMHRDLASGETKILLTGNGA